MDRGGTITWILDADDSRFERTMAKVRAQTAATSKSIDRDLKRGTDSGRRSLADFRQDLARSAQTFRNFQVALRGFQMTAFVVGVAGAGGAVIELVGALTAAVGAIGAVPGIIAPVIGAFSAVKVATLGMEDAFKALAKGDPEKLAEALKALSPAAQEFVKSAGRIQEAFKPIQRAVQENFFAGLGKQMEDVAKTSFPVVRVGLTNISTAMNGLLKEAARVAQEPFFQKTLSDTMATTAAATGTLTQAVDPLARAVSGLVQVGLPYTNMLAEWVVKLSESGAAYLTSAEGQRELTDTINTGISAIGKLVDLVGSVGDLFVSLFKVSNKEGLSLIDTLTQIVDNVNEWVNSAEGQKLLQSLFQVTNDVFLELAKTVGELLVGFLNVIDAFNNMNGPAKDIITQFLIWSVILGPILTYIAGLYNSLKLVGLMMREVLQFVGLWGPFTKGLTAARTGLINFVKSTATAAATISRNGLKAAAGWITSSASAVGAWFKSLPALLSRSATTAAATSKNGLVAAGGWISGIAKSVGAWLVSMGKIVAQTATTAAVASANGIKAAAGWVASAIRIAAVWTAQMAVAAARSFWLGFSQQAPAAAAALAWTANAIKIGVVWTAQMAIAGARAVAAGIQIAGQAIVAAGAWLIQAARIGIAWGIQMAITVGHTIAAGAQIAGQAIIAGLAWVTQPLRIAGAWIAQFVIVRAQAVATGAQVAGQAIVAGAGWLAQPVRIAALWTAQFVIMKAQAVAAGVQMGAQALKASGPWIAAAAASAGAWTLNFIKMIPFMLGTAVGMAAQAVIVSAAWIAGAVATAAAWVIANAAMLGVWGLIIAAVIGAVALIIANWDTIVQFFAGVWEGIQKGVAFVIDWVKNNWPLLLAILTGPIGIAVLLITQNWETIKNAFAAAWEFIKGVWGAVVGFFGGIGNGIANIFNNVVNGIKNGFNAAVNFVRGIPGNILNALGNLGNLLWNAGGDMIRGLVNGLSNGTQAVVNKIKEIASGALNAIKNFFGIKSPSRVMASMGDYMMQGLQNGIEKTGQAVVSSTKSLASDIADSLQVPLEGQNFSSTVTADVADIKGLDQTIGAQITARVPETTGTTAEKVVINQTNNVNTDIDMDQVNRNLAWELNKI